LNFEKSDRDTVTYDDGKPGMENAC
jgi:hypothetical protein